MAEQKTTKYAAIGEGGYNPKEFRNAAGTKKIVAFIPLRLFSRIKDIADKEDVAITTVVCHAIEEYFKAIDGYEEGNQR